KHPALVDSRRDLTAIHGGIMKSWIMRGLVLAMLLVCVAPLGFAQQPSSNATLVPAAQHPTETRTEANLVLPDLHQVSFLGVSGHTLLLGGIFVCILGGVF